MMLKYQSCPFRYGDMIHRFATPVPILSLVTNQMVDYIYSHPGHRVFQWHHEVLSPANLLSYVDDITGIGAPLPQLP